MSGMIAREVALATTGNNIGNLKTTGYKIDKSVDRVFEEVYVKKVLNKNNKLIGPFHHQVTTDNIYTNFKPGFPQLTNRTFDIFIEDLNENVVSFLGVEREGGTYFTRDGHLKLDANGNLTNNDGFFILNINGERINLSNEQLNYITIHNNGMLIDDQSGRTIDQLMIVGVEENNLNSFTKIGENVFSAPENINLLNGAYRIHQGMLETSNVDLNQEMINLLTAQTGYAMNAKSFQISDTIRDIESNRLGN